MSSTVGQLGNGSTAIGKDALKNHLLVPGRDNSAFGHEALQTLDNDQNESTAVGSQALTESVVGENSAFGAYAAARTGGTHNSAFGGWSMRHTNGNSNSAFGHRSLAGDNNNESVAPVTTASGEFNTAVGTNAMRRRPDGSYNTAMGYNSMRNISGNYASDNTGVGARALTNVTGSSSGEGYGNTATGRDAGRGVNKGSLNTFDGLKSGAAVTTGNRNTFTGAHSGELVTTGSDNTFNGVYSGKNATIGAENVYMGDNTGITVITGSKNTFIGANTDTGVDVNAPNAQRRTAIGADAKVDQDDSIVFGTNTSKVGIRVTAPQAALHVVTASMDDAIYAVSGGLAGGSAVRAVTTGPATAISVSSTGVGHALRAFTSSTGEALRGEATGIGLTDGVALSTNGGHDYKIRLIDAAAGVYNASINDHVIIVKGGVASTVNLPYSVGLPDGHVFIIRNASTAAVSLQCFLTPTVFVTSAVDFSSPAMFDSIAAGGNRTYISINSLYVRIA